MSLNQRIQKLDTLVPSRSPSLSASHCATLIGENARPPSLKPSDHCPYINVSSLGRYDKISFEAGIRFADFGHAKRKTPSSSQITFEFSFPIIVKPTHPKGEFKGVAKIIGIIHQTLLSAQSFIFYVFLETNVLPGKLGAR